MFSHITVGSCDLERAGHFYDALLNPLGLVRRLLTSDGGPAALCWVAIISLGIGQDTSAGGLTMIVAGCVSPGVLVFGGYALIFSTAVMIALYARARHWIEGVLSVTFAAAGLRLLSSPN